MKLPWTDEKYDSGSWSLLETQNRVLKDASSALKSTRGKAKTKKDTSDENDLEDFQLEKAEFDFYYHICAGQCKVCNRFLIILPSQVNSHHFVRLR